ncbi:hypothetical protein [Streptomyces murinus]|uniref:Lipoprotein n=1 Tax=Streptomyces murinus TaxID=33900 RepID=A0A7W3NTA9_STRMR|nr:hypothetical protein [Streptomyces murinus]MBA9056366.1 hypothetical protein [Streptomyces murinus]UWW90845.1 hypothetical protein GO605_08195 [Streptomyces murinus]WUD09708.1 hypothetical protein OG586_27480 [Streptomyces murinus]
MPYPSPPRIPSGPRVRRRTLLASAAGAALLAGCTSGADSGGDGPSATERARAQAAADSATLLGRYDAVLKAFPDLAERLRPLRTEVAAHAAAFQEGTTPTATPSASLSPSASPTPVPGSAKDALASLAAAERALADRRAKALLDVPGESARLLAATAAAGAAHAYLLTTGAAK